MFGKPNTVADVHGGKEALDRQRWNKGVIDLQQIPVFGGTNQELSEMAVYSRNHKNSSALQPAALSLLDRLSWEPFCISPELTDSDLEVATNRSHHVNGDICISAFNLSQNSQCCSRVR